MSHHVRVRSASGWTDAGATVSTSLGSTIPLIDLEPSFANVPLASGEVECDSVTAVRHTDLTDTLTKSLTCGKSARNTPL